VVVEEDLWVCGVAGEEEFHALTDVADEGEIVARLAVAVCWRLLDFVRLWSTEDRIGSI
jgi:hypothetical protein